MSAENTRDDIDIFDEKYLILLTLLSAVLMESPFPILVEINSSSLASRLSLSLIYSLSFGSGSAYSVSYSNSHFLFRVLTWRQSEYIGTVIAGS